MNNFFVAIPFVNEPEDDLESIYLNALSEKPYDFLMKLIKEFKIIKGDGAQIWFDQEKLKALFNEIKQNEAEKNRKPDIKELWNKFNDWNAIDISYEAQTIKGVNLDRGILCAYIHQNDSNASLVSDDIEYKSLQIDPLFIIPCDSKEIYKWLALHRDSKRVWDEQYAKHSREVKQGTRGAISSMSYTDEEYEEMLAWATGASGCNRKYYLDNEKSRLVIFWDENTDNKFHGYDVAADDADENAKLLKQGKKELLQKIELISGIVRHN